jgi:hypothetical protein
MRVPRVRFTVRRLMVAVAVVGVILGTYVTCLARAARFHERSESHLFRALDLVHDAGGGVDEAARSRLNLHVAWNEEMFVKYDRAARFPFLPVPPDPPEPE